jgi:hypothetical protein
MESSRMRAAWGILVAVGAFVVMVGIFGSIASDYIDSNGTLFSSPRGEINLVTATMDRMRYLIGRLQVR